MLTVMSAMPDFELTRRQFAFSAGHGCHEKGETETGLNGSK